MKPTLLIMTVCLLLAGCNTRTKTTHMNLIQEATLTKATLSIIDSTGYRDTLMLEKGIRNAARFWQAGDGTEADFVAFCVEHFKATPAAKKALFETVQRNMEIINGYYNQISLRLKEPVQLAGSDYTAVDETFSAFDPYAHLTDDLFESKMAFDILLNFPFYSLTEKNTLGANWSRLDWAYARAGDLITARVPAEINQQFAREMALTETYIANYNIRMDKLRSEDNRQLFPNQLSLISHWGLRDELKANYALKAAGLEKQELIYQVMKRIIDQTIPACVINNGASVWKPVSNTVSEGNKILDCPAEPDTRYARMLAVFKATKAFDPYNPSYPTAIERAFDRDMEVTADGIEALFTQVLASPEVAEVAALIKQRLGRPLRPFDIWYDGFKTRSEIPEDELSAKTRKRYPTTDAFKKDMPSLLIKLGFSLDKAQYISSNIAVDNARGSGHAWGSQMRGDKSHLRTRVQPDGMDYKGYNIALHEFGHNVEQTLSLNLVDNYLMSGVPSTAFTEALAFVFQKRDLEVLGYRNGGADKLALQTLDLFWGSYEIMGVSLLDLQTWKWLYAHPQATAPELKAAIIGMAKTLWNTYYEPYLGEKDATILAIYSHMIEYPLYLSNYPYGQLVEFQLEKWFGNRLPGQEILRMFPLGRLTPDYWMKAAVGDVVSTAPMLKATDLAVQVISRSK